MVTCGPGLRPVLEKVIPKRFFSSARSKPSFGSSSSRALKSKVPTYHHGHDAFERIEDDEVELDPARNFVTHVETGDPSPMQGEDSGGHVVGIQRPGNENIINAETDWVIERT